MNAQLRGIRGMLFSSTLHTREHMLGKDSQRATIALTSYYHMSYSLHSLKRVI